jgi:phosphatidylglycerophosphate synthase
MKLHLSNKGENRIKILIMIQMVAIISVIILVLMWHFPPPLNVLIILYVSLEAISTVSYYIAYTKLKSALESVSEKILREHLNSTSDEQQKS